MLKRLFRNRRPLQVLAGVAAIVLCSAQALADQHQHDTALPEELCNLCGFSSSAAALDQPDSTLQARACAGVQPAADPAAPLVSRPFEHNRCRAPPLS